MCHFDGYIATKSRICVTVSWLQRAIYVLQYDGYIATKSRMFLLQFALYQKQDCVTV